MSSICHFGKKESKVMEMEKKILLKIKLKFALRDHLSLLRRFFSLRCAFDINLSIFSDFSIFVPCPIFISQHSCKRSLATHVVCLHILSSVFLFIKWERHSNSVEKTPTNKLLFFPAHTQEDPRIFSFPGLTNPSSLLEPFTSNFYFWYRLLFFLLAPV